MKPDEPLEIEISQFSSGISLSVEGERFDIAYKLDLWRQTPSEVRKFLVENAGFAAAQFLPLIIKRRRVRFNVPVPIFEAQLFSNQLRDLPACEIADGVAPGTYLQSFFNLEQNFDAGKSTSIVSVRPREARQQSAVLPFTFGKESLLTLALCLKFGVRPILFYCQEPAHPHEEEFKLKLLRRFAREFDLEYHFVKNEAGRFRYGRAFEERRGVKSGTEVGWGTQTTILTLLALPMVYASGANGIFYGSESANNEFVMHDGWRAYLSYDQTPSWTRQQSNMIRLVTEGHCSVHAVLQPLEEISIFFMLHEFFPELGRYQFSCSAEQPLLGSSQWCHQCYKCERMFLFARSLGFDPRDLGFREDIMDSKGRFRSFFGKEFKTGSRSELKFAFSLFATRFPDNHYSALFRNKFGSPAAVRRSLAKHFGQLGGASEMPPSIRSAALKFYENGLARFRDRIEG